jgi:hypothetical protein
MGHIEEYDEFLKELDAVTGGAQMDGFIKPVRQLLCESGLPETDVSCGRYVELPGWHRPEKKWDLLVVSEGRLLAGIEFKSHIGSFGNNYLAHIPGRYCITPRA